jgi:hypothetical protein
LGTKSGSSQPLWGRNQNCSHEFEQWQLYEQLSTFLIGRKITQQAFPVLFQEYLDFEDFEIKDSDVQISEIPHYFNKYIFKAGFPEVILEEDGYRPPAAKRILQQYPPLGHSSGPSYPEKHKNY